MWKLGQNKLSTKEHKETKGQTNQQRSQDKKMRTQRFNWNPRRRWQKEIIVEKKCHKNFRYTKLHSQKDHEAQSKSKQTKPH